MKRRVCYSLVIHSVLLGLTVISPGVRAVSENPTNDTPAISAVESALVQTASGPYTPVPEYRTALVSKGALTQAITATGTLNLSTNDPGKWQINALVTEADIVRVAIGQAVAFTHDAFPDRVFHGKVIQVGSKAVTVQSVVCYEADVEVTSPEPKFKPGMTANLRIIVAQHEDVLTIPNAALRFRPPGVGLNAAMGKPESDRIVYVVRSDNNHQPEVVYIQAGISDGSLTEVTKGLREGDRVVTGYLTRTTNRLPPASTTVTFPSSGPINPGVRQGYWTESATNRPSIISTRAGFRSGARAPSGMVSSGRMGGMPTAPTTAQPLPDDSLQAGILEEELNIDLNAAIQSYRSLITQFDGQRPLLANTIFRLGECYRRLGKTEEARAQYSRILSEFSDQAVLVKLSKRFLTAAEAFKQSGESGSSVGSAGEVSDQDVLLKLSQGFLTPAEAVKRSGGSSGSNVGSAGVLTTIFALQHAYATNIIAIIEPLLSAECKIVADPRTNTLVVSGPMDKLEALRQLIQQMDSAVPGRSSFAIRNDAGVADSNDKAATMPGAAEANPPILDIRGQLENLDLAHARDCYCMATNRAFQIEQEMSAVKQMNVLSLPTLADENHQRQMERFKSEYEQALRPAMNPPGGPSRSGRVRVQKGEVVKQMETWVKEIYLPEQEINLRLTTWQAGRWSNEIQKAETALQEYVKRHPDAPSTHRPGANPPQVEDLLQRVERFRTEGINLLRRMIVEESILFVATNSLPESLSQQILGKWYRDYKQPELYIASLSSSEKFESMKTSMAAWLKDTFLPEKERSLHELQAQYSRYTNDVVKLEANLNEFRAKGDNLTQRVKEPAARSDRVTLEWQLAQARNEVLKARNAVALGELAFRKAAESHESQSSNKTQMELDRAATDLSLAKEQEVHWSKEVARLEARLKELQVKENEGSMPSAEAEAKQILQAKMVYMKNLAEGVLKFAEKNNGLMPKDLAQSFSVRAPLAAPPFPHRMFEVACQGLLQEIKDPSQTILIREKEAVRTPDGQWMKCYAFVDTHVEVHVEPSGQFDTWEKPRLKLIKAAKSPGATLSQETAGIGVILGKEGEDYVIKSFQLDSVAKRSNDIRVGDRIIAVAQENGPPVQVKGLSLEEVVRLIRGPRSSAVRLTLLPAGKEASETRDVRLVREELKGAKIEIPQTQIKTIKSIE